LVKYTFELASKDFIYENKYQFCGFNTPVIRVLQFFTVYR